jgi:transcriptional regulator with XRE-family HTH domain
MLRELREMTQARLSKLTGIPQPAISAIEHDKENVGIERSKKLARVLKVHPATIAFADW